MFLQMAQFDGIQLSEDLLIPEWELTEKFIRIGGPGGQNVNRVATGVQLRWNVRSSSLPAAIKARIETKLRKKLTKEGDYIVEAGEHRRQSLNRDAARERLANILKEAMRRPKKRIATRPGAGATRKRLKAKKKRGEVKALRGKISRED